MGKRINTAVWLEKQQRWQIKVQKNGVRKTFTSSKPGRTGQREANAKADAWLDDGILSGRLKADALLDLYLKTVRETGSSSNLKKETYHVEHFIRPKIGRKYIDTVTENDCQEIINAAFRGKNPKTGEPYERSRKTLMNIRATINAFLKFCRRKKVTTLRPEELSIPKSARYIGKNILQPQDIVSLFSSDQTFLYGKSQFDDYIYAYRFAVLTGLRPGELRGLHWEDVEGDRVTIRRSINENNETTRGKNQNALRAFTLTRLAKDVLNSQRLLQLDPVFVFPILSTSTFRHRWEKYCQSNNITYVPLYSLRHTFISIVKSLPEGEVKELVGHSKSMDTFGVYGHEVKGESEKAAENVNTVFQEILEGII